VRGGLVVEQDASDRVKSGAIQAVTCRFPLPARSVFATCVRQMLPPLVSTSIGPVRTSREFRRRPRLRGAPIRGTSPKSIWPAARCARYIGARLCQRQCFRLSVLQWRLRPPIGPRDVAAPGSQLALPADITGLNVAPAVKSARSPATKSEHSDMTSLGSSLAA